MERKTGGPPKSIKVVETYDGLGEYLEGFRGGHFTFMVLIGSPGTGKSRIVRQALGDYGCWIEGTATAFGLYSSFYKYRDRPIVLDDIDSIYAYAHCVSLLKSVCRTEPSKRVAWNARNGFLEREGLPKEFTTTSPVMLICNEWKTLTKNVAALEDRGQVLNFRPGPREIHAQAGTWFADKEIYDWYGTQLHRIEVHSLRSYVKSAQLKACGIDWKFTFSGKGEKDSRESLARELLADESFAGNEERAKAFIKRGGGCRGTFFSYRRKILGMDVAEAVPESPPRKVGRPRKEISEPVPEAPRRKVGRPRKEG